MRRAPAIAADERHVEWKLLDRKCGVDLGAGLDFVSYSTRARGCASRTAPFITDEQ